MLQHIATGYFESLLIAAQVTGTTPPSDWEGDAPLPFERGCRIVGDLRKGGRSHRAIIYTIFL